jgi:hypothetical protein
MSCKIMQLSGIGRCPEVALTFTITIPIPIRKNPSEKTTKRDRVHPFYITDGDYEDGLRLICAPVKKVLAILYHLQ